jgi:hypothetical protein
MIYFRGHEILGSVLAGIWLIRHIKKLRTTELAVRIAVNHVYFTHLQMRFLLISIPNWL